MYKMAFDPKKLPAKVYKAFKLGPGVWPIMIEAAIEENMLDVDELTSIMFYLHHPERLGRPLKSDETGLINEWKAYRKIIKPRVDAAAKSSGSSSGLPTGKQQHKPYYELENTFITSYS